jgi:hypothetical protein
MITTPMNIFNQISVRIIKEQELIIGPVAWDEARKVVGLTVVNSQTSEIAISDNSKEVIDGLVAQYERLFGRASHEVCREAAHDLIATLPPEDVPSSLR